MEVECEVIDVDDIEGEKEACLVGRLVTEKQWNHKDLIEAIKKAWKPKYGMSLREWGESKLILFRFNDAIERDWVLKHQPWVFEGSLFAIKKFTGGNEEQLSSSVNVTIKHASFWARLYDVPISCMNKRSLRLFTNQIGILESVDKSDEDSVGKFIRFKISVNIAKPLLTGITIRVKGKCIWLPLRYESLPIYCVSCGIIDHDHKNSESLNQKLKYSTCKLRVSSSEKIEQDTPTTLPHDIIENILSRVPVKYLTRFKVVSKQWKATISDPKFTEIHLQQFKSSSSRNLLAWDNIDQNEGILVAKFQKYSFQFVSAIELPSEYISGSGPPGILCDCDGLYLKHCLTCEQDDWEYVLWNPSCRAFKTLLCPQIIDDAFYGQIYGIYYNPLVKDYRAVFADKNHYAVVSCRYNKWSEVKKIEGISFMDEYCERGVSCNGSFYWPCTTRVEGKVVEFGIICFGWKDEKFRKLTMPDSKRKANDFHLTSCGGQLCLFSFFSSCDDEIMRIVKKVDDDEKDLWVEFKVRLEYIHDELPCSRVICWVSEHEIVLAAYNRTNFTLYDLRTSTFEYVNGSRDSPVLYLENLFIQ